MAVLGLSFSPGKSRLPSTLVAAVLLSVAACASCADGDPVEPTGTVSGSTSSVASGGGGDGNGGAAASTSAQSTSVASASTGPGSGGNGGNGSGGNGSGGNGSGGNGSGGNGSGGNGSGGSGGNGSGGNGSGGGVVVPTGNSGTETVSAGQRSTSPSYRMVFTLGQPTQNQGRMSSPSYRLQGGLSGTNGSLP